MGFVIIIALLEFLVILMCSVSRGDVLHEKDCLLCSVRRFMGVGAENK